MWTDRQQITKKEVDHVFGTCADKDRKVSKLKLLLGVLMYIITGYMKVSFHVCKQGICGTSDLIRSKFQPFQVFLGHKKVLLG